jgi:hypothetical protein
MKRLLALLLPLAQLFDSAGQIVNQAQRRL